MSFTAADLSKPAVGAVALLTIFGTLSGGSTNAQATDQPSIDSSAYNMPVAAESSGWQFRVTPYVWIPGVSGDVTVRGNPVDIDFNVFDVFDSGSSGVDLDSLAALMGYLEASNGRWSIYGDVVWGKFGLSGDAVAQRNPTANLSLSAGANAGLDYETTMVESGVAYQVANWSGAQSSTALDLLGGARYWNQELDLSLAVTGAVDFGRLGLERSGSRAVARSGTIDWVDPFVGVRVRHELSPGNELQFLGDVGGFGVGSDFSWQLFAGYSCDFSVWQSTLHGLVGYRALAVDYSEGSGTKANSIDLVLHGPVAGLSFRW
jgi:hypothetical protein